MPNITNATFRANLDAFHAARLARAARPAVEKQGFYLTNLEGGILAAYCERCADVLAAGACASDMMDADGLSLLPFYADNGASNLHAHSNLGEVCCSCYEPLLQAACTGGCMKRIDECECPRDEDGTLEEGA